jgi:septal ring factor EnvC (AmiA/AmiB activator)
MQMTETSETQIKTEQVESAAPSKQSKRKSILALSVFALGLNATAAVYTMSPSDFALPNVNVSGLVAELLPHERAPTPIPDSVVATLKDIQTVQLQQAAALQQHSALLLQNTALLQQDSATFDALRHSLTDEKGDVKNISSQLSKLTSKVDSLQNAIASEITASISKGLARNRLSSAARKKLARSLKPTGPISLGGAPLTTAPQGPQQSPES